MQRSTRIAEVISELAETVSAFAKRVTPHLEAEYADKVYSIEWDSEWRNATQSALDTCQAVLTVNDRNALLEQIQTRIDTISSNLSEYAIELKALGRQSRRRWKRLVEKHDELGFDPRTVSELREGADRIFKIGLPDFDDKGNVVDRVPQDEAEAAQEFDSEEWNYRAALGRLCARQRQLIEDYSKHLKLVATEFKPVVATESEPADTEPIANPTKKRKSTRKRGAPKRYDRKTDKKVWKRWNSLSFTTFKALATELKMKPREVRLAVDRENKRLSREGKNTAVKRV